MLFPMFISLEGKKCIIVGGGPVACRKTTLLLKFGAEITMIAPVFYEKSSHLGKDSKVKILNKYFQEEDLKGAFLVIAATDDPDLNKRIAAYCVQNNIHVNVADNVDQGNFTFPAIAHKGDVVCGISTSNKAPIIASKIRKDIEDILPDWIDEATETLSKAKDMVKEHIKEQDIRKIILKNIMDAVFKNSGVISDYEIMQIIKNERGMIDED